MSENCTSAGVAQGVRPSPREVIAQAHRALLEQDVNGFADRFAEDAVLEFPFAPEASMPARVEGRESIRSTAVAISRRMQSAGRRLRAIDNVVVHETTDPEVVVVEFEALGESTVSESSYKMPDIQVWRVRNGEVVSMRDYMGAHSQLPRPAPAKRIPGSTWA